MAQPLAGKVAVVTGASSGIGQAAAVKLAEAGADVTMCYHSGKDAAETTAEQITSLGRKALPYKIDVSDQAAVEAMVAETVQQLGRVDVFVSSAVYSDREPFLTAEHGRLPQDARSVDVRGLLLPAGVLQPDGQAGPGRCRR